jgi:hypothetical protein
MMNNHSVGFNKMVQRSGCGAHIAYAGLAMIALLLANGLQVGEVGLTKIKI